MLEAQKLSFFMPAEASTYQEKVRELNALREQLAQKERAIDAERKEVLQRRKAVTRHPHCDKIINNWALASMAAALVPTGLDMAALTGIQIKMIDSLAERFGKNYTEAQARHTLAALSGGVIAPLAGPAVASGAMFIPILGPTVAFLARPAAAFASTKLVGHLAVEHLEREQKLGVLAGEMGEVAAKENELTPGEQGPPSSQ
jgi:uncharacterized protein (DUF697 family)